MENFFHNRDNSEKVISASKAKIPISLIILDPYPASAEPRRSLGGKHVTIHNRATWAHGPNDWLAARREAAHPRPARNKI